MTSDVMAGWYHPGMTKVAVQLRCDGTLVSGLDALAGRLGYSRNELMVLILDAGVKTLDGWTAPADVLAEGIGAALVKVIQEPLVRPTVPPTEHEVVTREAYTGVKPETGRHLHRFVKVEGSEHPGKLLGTVEAEFECTCGKSKMELVKK